jgi:Ca-activated chloride channel family protein
MGRPVHVEMSRWFTRIPRPVEECRLHSRPHSEEAAVKNRRLVLACAVVTVLVHVELALRAGQEPPGAPATQVFRSRADLVALNVVVTDGHKLVGGLGPGDFTVLEDGVAQDVTFFATRDVPLDLAILVDTSASMTAKMPVVREAAKGLLQRLRSGDRALVVDLKVGMRILHPLGGELPAAVDAIDALEPGGGTALYNGLYATYRNLVKQRQSFEGQVRRQAIAVLSDGLDTSSLLAFEDVLDAAKESGIATYTITLMTPEGFGLPATTSRVLGPSEFGMKTLAEETGARPFFPRAVGELKDVYAAIGAELSQQYAMGYSPKIAGGGGQFRRIHVRVADRPDLRARTRSGYMPPRASRGGEVE